MNVFYYTKKTTITTTKNKTGNNIVVKVCRIKYLRQRERKFLKITNKKSHESDT
jgi:hypothetical protein